jgi:hypothetical protein
MLEMQKDERQASIERLSKLVASLSANESLQALRAGRLVCCAVSDQPTACSLKASNRSLQASKATHYKYKKRLSNRLQGFVISYDRRNSLRYERNQTPSAPRKRCRTRQSTAFDELKFSSRWAKILGPASLRSPTV